jgi:hypothetical protein
MSRALPPEVLQVNISARSGAEYRIHRAHDGVVYCDCPGWKFSKAAPKTCKHLERWSTKQPRTSSPPPTRRESLDCDASIWSI